MLTKIFVSVLNENDLSMIPHIKGNDQRNTSKEALASPSKNTDKKEKERKNGYCKVFCVTPLRKKTRMAIAKFLRYTQIK